MFFNMNSFKLFVLTENERKFIQIRHFLQHIEELRAKKVKKYE